MADALTAVAPAGSAPRRAIPAAAAPPRAPVALPALRGAPRALGLAGAMLALSALTDSSVEHYRGSFHNKFMYLPLAVAALTLAACARDVGRGRPRPLSGPAIDRLAIATGALGTGFHLYNVGKRPGGFCWLNLFYAAPLGAPGALLLAGLLRRVGGKLHNGRDKIAGVEAGPALAGLVSASLVATSAEAALLHFRGAFQNPAMVIPVTAPPVAAALLAHAALKPQPHHPATRWSLRLLAAVGLIGCGFHACGIGRSMGGWRNWSQNLLSGPPLPAPPAFTALAIAGLAALGLIERTQR
jgi:hypothetical protein